MGRIQGTCADDVLITGRPSGTDQHPGASLLNDAQGQAVPFIQSLIQVTSMQRRAHRELTWHGKDRPTSLKAYTNRRISPLEIIYGDDVDITQVVDK